MHRGLVAFCLLLSCLLLGNSAWIQAKAFVAQLLIRQAWINTVKTGEHTKPWPWADFWPVARVTVEKTHRELFVLNVASGEALSFGPGRVNYNGLRASPSSMTIAGHRDTHFGFLRGTSNGDQLAIESADGSVRSYEFTGKEIVDARYYRLWPAAKNTLQLVTCYPLDAAIPGGPLRLVMRLAEIQSLDPV